MVQATAGPAARQYADQFDSNVQIQLARLPYSSSSQARLALPSAQRTHTPQWRCGQYRVSTEHSSISTNTSTAYRTQIHRCLSGCGAAGSSSLPVVWAEATRRNTHEKRSFKLHRSLFVHPTSPGVARSLLSLSTSGLFPRFCDSAQPLFSVGSPNLLPRCSQGTGCERFPTSFIGDCSFRTSQPPVLVFVPEQRADKSGIIRRTFHLINYFSLSHNRHVLQ